MFSTSPAEALPVRTPANSLVTTCSVFCILSSASSKMSSVGMAGRITNRTAASSGHERPHGLPEHNGLQVVRLEQVEDDDRHFVVHAERKCGRVHHPQLFRQRLAIGD